MKTQIKILLLLSIFLGIGQYINANSPKLLVVVKINGFQQEHIQLLEKELSVGGFRKIINESLYFERLKHPILPSQSSDIATILTGTYPNFNGITADNYFNKRKETIKPILRNEKDEFYSANSLITTTITDQLKLKYPLSKVHSIAINPQNAILLGGHNANSVTWIDAQKKQWTTSPYYNKLSYWAKEMNKSQDCQTIINKTWTPIGKIINYQYPTENGSRTKEFAHSTNNKNRLYPYQISLANMPNGNELVYQLAQRVFENENLGMDNYCDALMLNFNVLPFNTTNFTLHSAEQEDMYVRLDEILQHLIYQIETKLGKENVLFVLLGNTIISDSVEKLKQNKILVDYFKIDRAIALLNSYLTALYGQEKWISQYFQNQIYLNYKAIKKKNIKLSEIKKEVIDFFNNFEGVTNCYPSEVIQDYNLKRGDIINIFQNSTNPKNRGDVFVVLKNGWEISKNKQKTGIYPNPFQSYYSAFFMGNNLKPRTINTIYQTIDIAPTLSDILNIDYPNGCIGTKIIFKKE